MIKTTMDKQQEKKEILLFRILISICIIALTAILVLEATATPHDLEHQGLDAAIQTLILRAPNHRLNDVGQRQQFVFDIQMASQSHNVPASLVLVIAYLESSLSTTVIGSSHGEVGLMQVHGVAASGCNLDSQEGQLICGAKWLSVCKQQCGSWKNALTAYATGHCTFNDKRIQRKISYRLAFWRQIQRKMEQIK